MTPPQAAAAAVLAVLLPVLAAGCDAPSENVAQGYVEGDFLFIAAERSGRIAELATAEGVHVAAGTRLFRLDTAVDDAALAAAEARARQAGAELEDRRRGARPQRLAVLAAAVDRAEADLALAEKQLGRAQVLYRENTVPRARLDEAVATHDGARARLHEAREELALAKLPDREDLVAAAGAARDAARAEAERQRREVARHAVRAPAAGIVHELVRREGEVAPAGGTVAVFLPDDGRRAVFFVSQAQLARLDHGQEVRIGCDGCPPDLGARIDFISEEVEFTPPVIFGPAERHRLLVRVEAAFPPAHAALLKPGQPITVTLFPDGGADDGR